MRFKPTRELCYLAGVMDNYRADEKSYVGIRTKNGETVERFVRYAVALGVDTRKIMIEQAGETQHAYFYHSKIARMIRDTLGRRPRFRGGTGTSRPASPRGCSTQRVGSQAAGASTSEGSTGGTR